MLIIIIPILLFTSDRGIRSAGEVVVNRTNYQGCQHDANFIQCQTFTDMHFAKYWN